MPKTSKAFWIEKFERNVVNDKKHARQLRKLGWQVITVWTCDIEKDPEGVVRKLKSKV